MALPFFTVASAGAPICESDDFGKSFAPCDDNREVPPGTLALITSNDMDTVRGRATLAFPAVFSHLGIAELPWYGNP